MLVRPHSSLMPHVRTPALHAGKGGTVHTWDLRMRRCLARLQDEGALRSSALAACPTNGQLAVGSDTGVVNLYDETTALTRCSSADDSHLHKGRIPKHYSQTPSVTDTAPAC